MKSFGAVCIILLVVIGPGCMNDKDSSNKSDQGNSSVSVKVSQISPGSISKTMPFQMLSQQIEVWNGCLDLINNQSIISAVTKVTTSRLRVTGWFGDTARGMPPVKAAFYFKSGAETYYAEIPIYILRLDVVDAFKKSNLGNTGFDEMVDITELPPGKYEMGLLGQTKNSFGKLELGLSIEK